MARIVKPLTDREIKSAKPESNNVTLRDGDGLYLLIRPTGTKTWYMDYYRPTTGKRANISLGIYPLISLSAAREKRREIRSLVMDGIDPKLHYFDEKIKSQIELNNEFAHVAGLWFEQKKKKISENYSKQVWIFLNDYVFPEIGKIPVTKISPPYVIEVMKKIASRFSDDFALRLCSLINQIMTYAVNTGLVQYNPLAGINAAFTAEPAQAMATIEHKELKSFLSDALNVKTNQINKLALMWQLHTMTRPAEAVSVLWDEIDLINKVWTIPSHKMKKKRDHHVPLTDQAIAILDQVKPYSKNRDYVFASLSKPNVPISKGTVNRIIGKTDFKGRIVAHGFRSLASTTLNELTDYRPDLIDECLAHMVRGQTESRYNRAKYIEQRRPIMCWWSEFIEGGIND